MTCLLMCLCVCVGGGQGCRLLFWCAPSGRISQGGLCLGRRRHTCCKRVVFAAVISRHTPPPPLEHAGLQQQLLLGSYGWKLLCIKAHTLCAARPAAALEGGPQSSPVCHLGGWVCHNCGSAAQHGTAQHSTAWHSKAAQRMRWHFISVCVGTWESPWVPTWCALVTHEAPEPGPHALPPASFLTVGLSGCVSAGRGLGSGFGVFLVCPGVCSGAWVGASTLSSSPRCPHICAPGGGHRVHCRAGSS